MDEYTLKVADEVILSREATRLRHELDRVEAQLHAVQEWLREAEAEAEGPLVDEPVPDWYGEDR